MDKCVRTERISNEAVLLEAIISYHDISKLTIAKMAGVKEKDIDRLLANPPEKVGIEVKYKIVVMVMELRLWLKDCELPI